MLEPDALKIALQEAVKGAAVCGRFCVTGCRVEDGSYYLHHNGSGSRDTDVQRVYVPGRLNQTAAGLTDKLREWVSGLHAGTRIDINA